MNTRIRFLLIMALTVLVAGALAGCSAQASQSGASAHPSAPQISVPVVVAGAAALPKTLTLTGTLVANRDSDVAADAAGKVVATYVERGSVVKKGAPLVALDKRSAALAQEQARAQAEIARTQLALAETECGRADRLFAENAINKAEHDRARAECDASRLRAEGAAAAARLASKSLGDAVVRAPFAGMVVDKNVTEGEYVRPDMKVVRLVEMNTLRLELAVPEAVLAQVTASQDVSFRVSAFANETFEGRIRYVGTALRRESRDLLVEAVVENHHGRLRPGMFATAEVTVGEVEQVIVPKAAVRLGNDQQDDRVFVLADGKIEERLVHVARVEGERVALASGLQPGETLVADASRALSDGQAAVAEAR